MVFFSLGFCRALLAVVCVFFLATILLCLGRFSVCGAFVSGFEIRFILLLALVYVGLGVG